MWPIGGLLLLLQAAAPGRCAPPAPDWPPFSFAAPRIEQQRPELRRVRDRLLAAIRERRARSRPRADGADDPRSGRRRAGRRRSSTASARSNRRRRCAEEWQALEQALRLGGVLRGGVYVLPFIERDAPALAAPARRGCSSPAATSRCAAPSPIRTAPIVARVSHALLQEAVGVPTRAGAAGSACPDWTPVIGPERTPRVGLHHRRRGPSAASTTRSPAPAARGS